MAAASHPADVTGRSSRKPVKRPAVPWGLRFTIRLITRRRIEELSTPILLNSLRTWSVLSASRRITGRVGYGSLASEARWYKVARYRNARRCGTFPESIAGNKRSAVYSGWNEDMRSRSNSIEVLTLGLAIDGWRWKSQYPPSTIKRSAKGKNQRPRLRTLCDPIGLRHIPRSPRRRCCSCTYKLYY